MQTDEFPSRLLPEIAAVTAAMLEVDGDVFEIVPAASRYSPMYSCSLVPATGWLFVADEVDAPGANSIEDFVKERAVQRYDLSDYKTVQWSVIRQQGFVRLKSRSGDVDPVAFKVQRGHAKPLARRLADLGVERSRRSSAILTILRMP